MPPTTRSGPTMLGVRVVQPSWFRPTSTANVSRHGPRSSARDRTILAVKESGRRRWKKTAGYHRQARVKNAFFRSSYWLAVTSRLGQPYRKGEILRGPVGTQ